MAVTLDLMEYADNAAAQAAYVTDGIGTQEITTNPDFETWTGGDAVAPDGWDGTYSAPASIAKGSTSPNPQLGSYYLKFTNTAATMANMGNAIHATRGIEYWKGKTITFGCWVYATVADRVYLGVGDGVGVPSPLSSFHTGSSTWEFLTVTKTIDGSATTVDCWLFIGTGTTITASFDNAKATEGTAVDYLQSYSEPSIKTQGSYSLKGVAVQDDSLNDTLTKSGLSIDLTDQILIKYDIRASRTGSNIKIGIHDVGGTTTEHTANISQINTWEPQEWNISGVSDANKDDIDDIIVEIINADDSTNTFYIDNIRTVFDYVKNFTDDVATLSEPTFVKGVSKIPLDTATLSEPSFLRGLGKNPSETVTLSEVYARTWALIREWSETATLSEPAFVKAVARIFGDVYTLSDEIKKATARGFADTATLSEVFGRSMTLQRWVETVTLSEVAQRAINFILLELTTLSDVVIRAMSRAPTDTATLSDVFQRTMALQRWVDTLTITDVSVTSLGKTFLDVATLLEAINKWHLPAAKTTTWTEISDESGMWTKEEAGIEWKEL